MLSLEPATVTDRRYPLLLETGETVYGVPLVDAQHPHDFVMELSVQYAHPPGEKGTWDVYYAPVGDPALGAGGVSSSPERYGIASGEPGTPRARLDAHCESRCDSRCQLRQSEARGLGFLRA